MLKIALVGPESTGKSELSHELARHYNMPWVPEFARSYVEKLDRPYRMEDVEYIARHQIKQECELRDNKVLPMVFLDTDLIITKVWMEYCYHQVPEYVNLHLKNCPVDFYLICFPDLPWEDDPVREHKDDREMFFEWYKKEIEHLNRPYVIVRGEGDNRTQNALLGLNDWLIKNRY